MSDDVEQCSEKKCPKRGMRPGQNPPLPEGGPRQLRRCQPIDMFIGGLPERSKGGRQLRDFEFFFFFFIYLLCFLYVPD